MSIYLWKCPRVSFVLLGLFPYQCWFAPRSSQSRFRNESWRSLYGKLTILAVAKKSKIFEYPLPAYQVASNEVWTWIEEIQWQAHDRCNSKKLSGLGVVELLSNCSVLRQDTSTGLPSLSRKPALCITCLTRRCGCRACWACRTVGAMSPHLRVITSQGPWVQSSAFPFTYAYTVFVLPREMGDRLRVCTTHPSCLHDLHKLLPVLFAHRQPA